MKVNSRMDISVLSMTSTFVFREKAPLVANKQTGHVATYRHAAQRARGGAATMALDAHSTDEEGQRKKTNDLACNYN